MLELKNWFFIDYVALPFTLKADAKGCLILSTTTTTWPTSWNGHLTKKN